MLKLQCAAELDLLCEDDGGGAVGAGATRYLQRAGADGDGVRGIGDGPARGIERGVQKLFIYQREVVAGEWTVRETEARRETIAEEIRSNVSVRLNDASERDVVHGC